jgi:hypothetical protein
VKGFRRMEDGDGCWLQQQCRREAPEAASWLRGGERCRKGEGVGGGGVVGGGGGKVMVMVIGRSMPGAGRADETAEGATK